MSKERTSAGKTIKHQQFLNFEREDSKLGREVHLLNYFHHFEDQHLIRNNYTHQSAIYIQNPSSEHIIFENNTFDSNVGTIGGAIHVDYQSRNEASIKHFFKYSPYLMMKNNSTAVVLGSFLVPFSRQFFSHVFGTACFTCYTSGNVLYAVLFTSPHRLLCSQSTVSGKHVKRGTKTAIELFVVLSLS